MSAVIEELEVRNFEGYEHGMVSFTEGLNLIKGRNSAGKSTLLNAILFALYGKVPDAHPRLLVSRMRGGGEMAVSIRFRSPATGAVVEVYRGGRLDGKGNFRTSKLALKVDGEERAIEGEEDLKKKVTEMMGLSLRKFASLVYVRQGALQEILEPRREDMDLMLRLTVARELREQVDEARKALEKYEGRDARTELQDIQARILPELQSSVQALLEDVGNLEREVKELRALIERAESPALLELLKAIEAKEKLERRLGEELNAAKTLLSQAGVESREELLELIRDAEGRMEGLRGRRAKLEEEVEGLRREWSSYDGRACALLEEIRRHEGLLKEGAATCPTCGQDLKAEALEGILESKRGAWMKLSRKTEELKRAYEDGSGALKELDEELGEVSSRVSELKRLESGLRSHFAKEEGLRGEIARAEEQIEAHLRSLALPLDPKDPELKVKVAQRLPLDPEQLEARRRELKAKEGRLAEKADELKKKGEELQAYRCRASELEGMLKAADLARKLSERLEAAVEARRGDVLRRIEARALAYYGRMTDQRDYDSIRIDPETYAVSIHPRNLVEHIPAKRDGGGHQTLVALALRLALLDVLGFRSLLILDEPTYGVDSENLPQLAEYIGEASKQLTQTILVTHHDICEEEASNIIEVSRDEAGASHARATI